MIKPQLQKTTDEEISILRLEVDHLARRYFTCFYYTLSTENICHGLTKIGFSVHPRGTPSNSEISLNGGKVLCWNAQNWFVLLSLGRVWIIINFFT